MKEFFKYVVIFLSPFWASCIKKPTYPSKPVIAYRDFLRYGNFSNPDSVDLVVSFTDNEGDVGLSQKDVQGIFSVGNIYLDYYSWDTAGTDHWSPVDDPMTAAIDTFKIAYRVPEVLPDGDSSEPMKGLIFVKQKPFVKIFDKIMFVVYLYDKAGNKSDTIHTPPIIF
jgi:hypothetical protein